LDGFVEKLRGYVDEVAKEFALSLIPLTITHVAALVKGLFV